MALANELPNAIITDTGLKITQLEKLYRMGIERAIEAQIEVGKSIDDDLLQYLSPLGWEHINLTGDYVWRQNKTTEAGKFRSLRLSKMLK
jgi:hypothetical protein